MSASATASTEEPVTVIARPIVVSKDCQYAQDYLEYCKGKKSKPDKDFVKWINKVDRRVRKELGMGLHDLPDEPYMVNYEQSYTCEEMAWTVIENTKSWIDFE